MANEYKGGAGQVIAGREEETGERVKKVETTTGRITARRDFIVQGTKNKKVINPYFRV